MRTPAPVATNPANESAQPNAAASVPACPRKARGTVTKGQYSERTGLLGTFVAGALIDSVSYFGCSPGGDFPEGCVFVSVTRSMWVNWRGYVSNAQFEALRTFVGRDKVRPAFPSTPVIP
jgi:hypothetical protein